MMRENQRVCVIGIWHLGSVYSTCLADLGYRVTGVDPDAERVRDLNSGIPPIFEPGLKELLTANIRSGKLSYTTDVSSAMKGCKFALVTLSTAARQYGNSLPTPRRQYR